MLFRGILVKLFIITLLVALVLSKKGKTKKDKRPKEIEFKKPPAKFDNPDNVRDRPRDFDKLDLPQEWVNTHERPFNSAWMDYCDPYHCNDYHRRVCGLNRKRMDFRWFQSSCHLILNNMCASFRGNLKYDVIDTKYCDQYGMFLRSDCPPFCDKTIDPVCAVNLKENRVSLFRNRCALEMSNCQVLDDADESEEISMDLCVYALEYSIRV